MGRFIKTIASTIFGHPVYSLDWPSPSMAVSGPHEEFFNISFGICIGGKHFLGGCCRTIRMHEVWKSLGLRQHILEHLLIMRQEVYIRWSIVVVETTGFNGAGHAVETMDAISEAPVLLGENLH